MDWADEGTVIARRPHGETAMLVEVMTRAHGRHAGVVPGGQSSKRAAMLQPGSRLALRWRARLSDHLGQFTAEPVRSRAHLLGDPLALAGLNAVCALLSYFLAERDPHPGLHDATEALLDGNDWGAAYVGWECDLLAELGYGLDLSACAVTGARDGLVFVSPRSGRAVSRAGAGDWADRLLPLPPGLSDGRLDASDLPAALSLTGHFLTRAASDLGDRPLPAARGRLVDRLSRRG
ncbi:DNA repair protein RecO [Paracoccus sp. p3-h83]|uniref:DNA repair protein RecO n=1 Tax=Paracoccus sp. p3-h83 TaxID=3342805 RepID=UPI0035B7B52D